MARRGRYEVLDLSWRQRPSSLELQHVALGEQPISETGTAQHQRVIRSFGNIVLVGTDSNDEAGTPAKIQHGTSLHDELERLVRAGLTPVEALRGAGALAASTFELVDRGAVEPGRRADLVLVEGDPASDISTTRNIRGVWIGGIRTP